MWVPQAVLEAERGRDLLKREEQWQASLPIRLASRALANLRDRSSREATRKQGRSGKDAERALRRKADLLSAQKRRRRSVDQTCEDAAQAGAATSAPTAAISQVLPPGAHTLQRTEGAEEAVKIQDL